MARVLKSELIVKIERLEQEKAALVGALDDYRKERDIIPAAAFRDVLRDFELSGGYGMLVDAMRTILPENYDAKEIEELNQLSRMTGRWARMRDALLVWDKESAIHMAKMSGSRAATREWLTETRRKISEVLRKGGRV